MSHPTIKRARITVHSTDLCCQVRRAIGWTSVCACGAPLPIRRRESDAREDARLHILTCGKNSVTTAG